MESNIARINKNLIPPTTNTNGLRSYKSTSWLRGFRLDNGLEVIVIADNRAPVVTHMLWYKVGAADDPQGKSGIANFLEHLMFKGTEKHPAGELSRKIAAIGGQENAFTSYDFTAYFQRVPKEYLKLCMEYEADRMKNIRLPKELIAAERNVIKEERRMRVDGNPDEQLGESLMASMFSHSPYGTPIIGWMDEIAKLDENDAVGFYKQYYAPNNAILVVAGDVEAGEVVNLAREIYGKLEVVPVKNRVRHKSPTLPGKKLIKLDDPKVVQPMLVRLYNAPSNQSTIKLENEALEIATYVLGGSMVSRLYQVLVHELKVAVAASVYYQPAGLGTGWISMRVIPAEGTLLDMLEKQLDSVVASLRAAPPTDEEIERAKNRLTANVIFARDSQVLQAQIFGEGLALGKKLEYIQEYPKRIASVGRAEILAACQYFDNAKATTGYLTYQAYN